MYKLYKCAYMLSFNMVVGDVCDEISVTLPQKEDIPGSSLIGSVGYVMGGEPPEIGRRNLKLFSLNVRFYVYSEVVYVLLS